MSCEGHPESKATTALAQNQEIPAIFRPSGDEIEGCYADLSGHSFLDVEVEWLCQSLFFGSICVQDVVKRYSLSKDVLKVWFNEYRRRCANYPEEKCEVLDDIGICAVLSSVAQMTTNDANHTDSVDCYVRVLKEQCHLTQERREAIEARVDGSK